MRGRPAKLLAEADVRALLRAAERRRHPLRNRAMVLLSVRAGLRAGEIAALRWQMIEDPRGRVSGTIELPAFAAKRGSGRRIPIHRELRLVLIKLRKREPDAVHVITSERGRGMSAGSVVNWFTGIYRELGLAGCSSHSGRRTFVTRAARLVHRAGGSLRDVQELAGHRSIKTTERYIEGDRDVQRRLIRLL